MGGVLESQPPVQPMQWLLRLHMLESLSVCVSSAQVCFDRRRGEPGRAAASRLVDPRLLDIGRGLFTTGWTVFCILSSPRPRDEVSGFPITQMAKKEEKSHPCPLTPLSPTLSTQHQGTRRLARERQIPEDRSPVSPPHGRRAAAAGCMRRSRSTDPARLSG